MNEGYDLLELLWNRAYPDEALKEVASLSLEELEMRRALNVDRWMLLAAFRLGLVPETRRLQDFLDVVRTSPPPDRAEGLGSFRDLDPRMVSYLGEAQSREGMDDHPFMQREQCLERTREILLEANTGFERFAKEILDVPPVAEDTMVSLARADLEAVAPLMMSPPILPKKEMLSRYESSWVMGPLLLGCAGWSAILQQAAQVKQDNLEVWRALRDPFAAAAGLTDSFMLNMGSVFHCLRSNKSMRGRGTFDWGWDVGGRVQSLGLWELSHIVMVGQMQAARVLYAAALGEDIVDGVVTPEESPSS